jgi:hypothetical protein
MRMKMAPTIFKDTFTFYTRKHDSDLGVNKSCVVLKTTLPYDRIQLLGIGHDLYQL